MAKPAESGIAALNAFVANSEATASRKCKKASLEEKVNNEATYARAYDDFQKRWVKTTAS